MPSPGWAVRLAVTAIVFLLTPTLDVARAQVDALPVLDPISDASVAPDEVLDVPLHASDPEGESVTFTTNFAPPFVSTLSTGPNDGIARLAPGFADIGSAVITVVALDALEGVDWSTFTATISPPAGVPVAYAGGPYNGNVVEFDGTRSSDPAGSPLTYLWDFGDGATGTGPNPVHYYAVCSSLGCPPGAAGSYVVSLTVTDAEGNSSRGTTYVIVTDLLTAGTAFPSKKAPFIKIPAGQATVCFQVQGGPFAAFDPRYVDLSAVQMSGPYGAPPIDAIDTKTSLVGDTNGDGVVEIQTCFRSEDMASLVELAPSGRAMLQFVISGPLRLAGRFRASFTCTIFKGGPRFAAQILPNPVRSGVGTLEFATDEVGPARAELFDVRGRLVRVLLDEPSLPAGAHSLGIDVSGATTSLPRGIYFYRVAADGADATGKLVLAR